VFDRPSIKTGGAVGGRFAITIGKLLPTNGCCGPNRYGVPLPPPQPLPYDVNAPASGNWNSVRLCE
jgi:hypothetical protein